MNPMALLAAFSSSGPLASRAFLPLFMLSVSSVYGDVLPAYHLPVFVLPPGMEWIGSPWFLAGSCILAMLEILADKDPDIQQALQPAMPTLKAIVAILVSLAILPQEAVGYFNHPGTATLAQVTGFLSIGGMVALIVATLTFWLARLRNIVTEFFDDLDPDDDFSIRWLVSLAEDVCSLLGMVLCLLFPILGALLAGMLLLGAAMAVWVIRRIEDRGRGICSAACKGTPLPTAVCCPTCRVSRRPESVLVWGWRKPSEWNDAVAQAHRLKLLSKHRCPNCAERLEGSALLAKGCQCGFQPGDDAMQVLFEPFHRAVKRRALILLLPLTLLSAIPIVGFAIALVMVKYAVARPYRTFLGFAGKKVGRWGLRLLTILLLLLGAIPLVSILAAPILILVNLAVYGHLTRNAFQRAVATKIAGREAVAN